MWQGGVCGCLHPALFVELKKHGIGFTHLISVHVDFHCYVVLRAWWTHVNFTQVNKIQRKSWTLLNFPVYMDLSYIASTDFIYVYKIYMCSPRT